MQSPDIYLRHLCLGFSSQEAQIVDLILHHKVLLLTLEILQAQHEEMNSWQMFPGEAVRNTGAEWRLTWDLHHRMKISATILKSSVESASGSFSHLDLERDTSRLDVLHNAQENPGSPGDWPVVTCCCPRSG